MLSRIFPKQIDNAYRGHWLAVWLLVPVVLLRAVMGFNSMVFTRLVATNADGIPLDSYTGGGAEAVIALFALLGLYLLLLSFLGAVVLIRYRAMIPFLYLLLLIQQLGSRAILLVNPIAKSAAAAVSTSGLPIGSIINYALLAMLLAGFVLSLRKSDSPQAKSSAGVLQV